MKIIEITIARKAFTEVSKRKVLKSLFTVPGSYYLSDLYFTSIFSLVFCAYTIHTKEYIGIIPGFGLFIILIWRIDATLKFLYEEHHNHLKDALNQYRADIQLIRFLLFKEKIDPEV